MIEGWELKPLKDVCTVFTDGNWIQTKDQSSEGIRLVQTGNIGFGFFKNKEDKARYISEETFIKLKCTEILAGDLLISRLPDPVGKSCIIPNLNMKMITSIDCTIIRLKEYMSSEFLRYYQMSDQYLKDVEGKVSGTTRSRISRKNLGLVEIPIPLLYEQKQIVTTLNKAFKQIDQAKANLEKNLNSAKELFQSKLNEVFSQRGEGWEEYEINEICESIIDCINKTAPSIIDETPFKMIRTTNIRFGKVNLEKVKYVTKDTYKLWTRRQKPKRGDLLFTREAPMGEIGMLLSDDNVFLGQRIVSYRIDKTKANSYFILYAFQSSQIQEQVKELGSGATVQHLRVPHTKEFKLLIPSLSKQKNIVSILRNLKEESEKLETHYQQKLNNLEELKKSILQKAFKGELV